MTTSASILPPRPDVGLTPEAPKKRRFWPIIGSVIGGLIVLGAIGSALENRTETTTPDPVTPIAVPERTFDDAAAEATPLLDQAVAELDQITRTSAISSDIVHLNNIADLYDEAGAAFEGVDETQAMYLHSAADHFRSAALTWPADSSQAEIAAATGDLEAATRALS